MKMACDQAELGLEQTTPNPCVGCVILDSKDLVLGLGHHKKFGEAHAEVEAINSNPSSLQDATVFVTLEPCAHEGKTPSCAKLLAEKPISKVIYLLKDPNPLVSGEGQKTLESTGIKVYCVETILDSLGEGFNFYLNGFKKFEDKVVQHIVDKKSFYKKLVRKQKYLNRQFLHSMTSDVPYITLKWAQTLNFILGEKENRLMITNQEVQKEVHHLRACHDVILVGKNTILNDDPLLNNRFGSSKRKLNTIAILDPELEIIKSNTDLKVFETHSKNNLIFITSKDVDISREKQMGYNIIQVHQEGENKLDILEALKLIKKIHKINSIFVEGGPEVFSSMLNRNLFDELYVFSAFTFNFKKQTIRIRNFNFFKFIFKNLIKFRIKIYDQNILVHYYFNRKTNFF